MPPIQDLRSGFRSTLLDATHHAYESARRIWNGMIDRKPAYIARCSSAAEVQAALQFGKAEGLHLSVRGGGHNIAGNSVCDRGLMIDLSPMKNITIDPVLKHAVAEPGVLWGEFDTAAAAHGLATTGGQVSHTGIAALLWVAVLEI